MNDLPTYTTSLCTRTYLFSVHRMNITRLCHIPHYLHNVSVHQVEALKVVQGAEQGDGLRHGGGMEWGGAGEDF
jgi:hypothetical protein